MGVVDDEAREHQSAQEPVDGDADPAQREEDLQVQYTVSQTGDTGERYMDLLRKMNKLLLSGR